jgi:hypothetical protein
MDAESRDSVSLKPPELDVLAQVLRDSGSGCDDATLEQQIEHFTLVALAVEDDEIHGFLFGSLERIGGTPCVLWGMGAVRKGKSAPAIVKLLTAELYRRAAISFPDEDVLVAGRVAHPAAYAHLASLSDTVPRPGYRATGEERAWGRRLAKRFGCDARYDDRTFLVNGNGGPEPRLDTSSIKQSPRPAVAELLAGIDVDGGGAMIGFGWAMAESLAAVLAEKGR